MILDARRHWPRERLDCDLCIVGGGPAGIALARELDDGRRSIVILEAGGTGVERATQELLAGAPDDSGYPPLQAARIGALGGSTHVWAGWCRPFDPIDFDGWPFGREELDAHYARAHELLGLGEPDYSPDAWERSASVARPAIDEDRFGAVLFRRADVGFAKRHAAELRASGNVRALLHASLLRIGYSPDGRSVASVTAASAPERTFVIRPRTLVLAAGGIENARLLLISDGGGRGPANRNGLVGRHFTEHVYVDGGSFVPELPGSMPFFFARSTGHGAARRTARGGWAGTEALLRHHRLLNAAIFFRPLYESDPAYADERVQSMLSAWDMVRGRAVPHLLAERLLHAASAPLVVSRALWRRAHERVAPGAAWRLRALCECSSDPDNRVELGDTSDALGRPVARVRWRIRDAELHSIMQTHALLAEAVQASGAGRVDLPPPDPDAWRSRMQPGLHHLGTTRMHTDPARGVVDPDSRVHGVDNLYVAGGSVFPTGGYANPTLTVVAMTLRLAAHLRGT